MSKPLKMYYDIRVRPEHIDDTKIILTKLRRVVGASVQLKDFSLIRRSIDARKSEVFFNLRFAPLDAVERIPVPVFQALRKDKSPVIIIGSGPAGLFAALRLLEHGIKPIILERGKDVRARRRDLRAIQQEGVVNPDSNYCFGEGGAGTYSDGKLYTRLKDKKAVRHILNILVHHGAHPDILIDAHPHIGSNKLPKIVAQLRKTILDHGGQIHFDTRVVDFEIRTGQIRSVIDRKGNSYPAKHVILATGHSARDIYYLLAHKGLRLEAKPFALGVRVEHPQALIDEIQYKQFPRHPNLPASSYRLSCQIEGQGIFSFCMCPGGLVVPAATSPGEIVVNGMSLSRRDSPYANSGIVCQIPSDWFNDGDPFAPLRFQKSIEQKCFDAGDGGQSAPAQRLTDFVRSLRSNDLPKSSYIPGLFSAALHQILPEAVYRSLCAGLMRFAQKMPGYLTSEAVVIGTESRTSAPIRIPRNNITFMHEELKGLYPCGEGAGYAGGIVSAAVDGTKVAEAIAQTI